MNPFDPAQVAEFWAQSARTLLDQQQKMTEFFTKAWPVPTTGAGLPSGIAAELGSTGDDLAKASQSWLDLGNAAASLFTTLSKPYAAIDQSGPAGAALSKMMDPRSWMSSGGEIDEVLGRMSEGPRLADLWDMERRQTRVLRAWVDMRRRAIEHNMILLQAWMEAGKRFSNEFAGRTAAGPLDAKSAMNVWTEIANRQLLETQRSEPFLAAQAAMIRASTDFRLAQQDLAEQLCERFGFPSRRELDDVHKTVTELRRELRAMKRSARPPPPAPRIEAPKPEPAAVPLRNRPPSRTSKAPTKKG